MNIFVTGGAGYIGSHVCKLLTVSGHSVVVYDNLSTGHRELARWGDFIHGDVRDVSRLRGALRGRGIDGVMHFAARSSVGESVIDPGLYYSNNTYGTLCLLEAMREAGIARFVLSGTASVYGDPDIQPISEDLPLRPVSPYGSSKLFAEGILADFDRAHGIRWVSLRYFNAAGSDPEGETGEHHDPETHLIPRVLMAAAGTLPGIDLYGDDYDTPDGTCIRDYIHVDDLARAHVMAMEYLAAGGTSAAMNLGTGTGLSVREIIAMSEALTGHKVPVTLRPRRAGDPSVLVADAGRAAAVLGWKPECSNAEHIITTAWNWISKLR